MCGRVVGCGPCHVGSGGQVGVGVGGMDVEVRRSGVWVLRVDGVLGRLRSKRWICRGAHCRPLACEDPHRRLLPESRYSRTTGVLHTGGRSEPRRPSRPTFPRAHPVPFTLGRCLHPVGRLTRASICAVLSSGPFGAVAPRVGACGAAGVIAANGTAEPCCYLVSGRYVGVRAVRDRR